MLLEQASKAKQLSWRAIKRGDIYCAPACGYGCTHAAYLTAHAKADKLIERLGQGWTKRIHENLGWWYEVQSPCGRIRVSNNYGLGFTAFLGEVNDSGGRWAEQGKTPEKAIAAVIRVAKSELAKIGAHLNGL